jgi:putative SOS response-associated peptidase YedK
MCGRYTLFELADLLKLTPWLLAPAEILEREVRYNVAPSQTMPIIRSKNVHLAQWGFVSATDGLALSGSSISNRPVPVASISSVRATLFRREQSSEPDARDAGKRVAFS